MCRSLDLFISKQVKRLCGFLLVWFHRENDLASVFSAWVQSWVFSVRTYFCLTPSFRCSNLVFITSHLYPSPEDTTSLNMYNQLDIKISIWLWIRSRYRSNENEAIAMAAFKRFLSGRFHVHVSLRKFYPLIDTHKRWSACSWLWRLFCRVFLEILSGSSSTPELLPCLLLGARTKSS